MKRISKLFVLVLIVALSVLALTACGNPKDPVQRTEEDFVEFGMFPQELVSDSALRTKLTAYVTTLANNAADYLTFTYEGTNYVRIKGVDQGETYKFSSGEVIKEQYYFFKMLPIRWAILAETATEYLLLSDRLLDVQRYVSTEFIEANTAAASAWETSDVRKYLNGEFIATAFSAEEQARLMTTQVVNDQTTTSHHIEKTATTNDKVFLLSEYDLINNDYGFGTVAHKADINRTALTTDFARARGAYYSDAEGYVGAGYYWTRSPNIYGNYASVVDYNGSAIYGMQCDASHACIRPVIRISK